MKNVDVSTMIRKDVKWFEKDVVLNKWLFSYEVCINGVLKTEVVNFKN